MFQYIFRLLLDWCVNKLFAMAVRGLVVLCWISTMCLTLRCEKEVQYCIVGAGPAGLQLGYLLNRENKDYIIFERSNISGNIFHKFELTT